MVATVLEIAGPVNFMGAQLIYLAQPFLKIKVTDQTLETLTGILEDPAQTQLFISSLREAEPR